MPGHPLEPLLTPRSIALIGASSRPGSVGELLLSNLTGSGFAGPIFAINPHPLSCQGARWIASVADLPQTVDLAILATPAATIPSLIAALGEAGTRIAVVVTGGITAGNGLRQAMIDAARATGLRIIGPNCLGVIMPHCGLNGAFARSHAKAGKLALISQSGALVTAMLDWAEARGLGFSGLVSIGDMADIDAADLIDLFAQDPQTEAIALYLEGLSEGARFEAAACAAAASKPVVAIKAGQSDASRQAIRSHTGALMGSAEVYSAAFRRAGIVEVETLTGLFDAAETLCIAPPAPGPRLAILSNGGGAGILAVDALASGPAQLAELHPSTLAALDKLLPPIWSRGNPVDIVGDAPPHRFADAMSAVLDDPGVDALLLLHCPTAVADGKVTAEAVAEVYRARHDEKPLLACWLGESNGRAAAPILNPAGIASYESPEEAVRGLLYLLAARRRPAGPSAERNAPTDAAISARRVVDGARLRGAEWLDAVESGKILSAYGIRTAPMRFGRTAEEVRAAAGDIAPPYAVKIVSPDILHKSDVGGVRLGLVSPAAAAAAAHDMAAGLREARPEASITGFTVESMVVPSHGHELIIGFRRDPVFGAVLIFGAGGKAVERIGDTTLELAPVDPPMAAAMIGRTRIARLLEGYRDEPAADLAGIAHAISRLSDLAADLPEIEEMEVNPLIAWPEGSCALDVRIRIGKVL